MKKIINLMFIVLMANSTLAQGVTFKKIPNHQGYKYYAFKKINGITKAAVVKTNDDGTDFAEDWKEYYVNPNLPFVFDPFTEDELQRAFSNAKFNERVSSISKCDKK